MSSERTENLLIEILECTRDSYAQRERISDNVESDQEQRDRGMAMISMDARSEQQKAGRYLDTMCVYLGIITVTQTLMAMGLMYLLLGV